MQISVHPLDPAQRRPKPKDEKNLVFGRLFSDHMFMMDYLEGEGWKEPGLSLRPVRDGPRGDGSPLWAGYFRRIESLQMAER